MHGLHRLSAMMISLAVVGCQPLFAQDAVSGDSTETNRMSIIPFLEGTDVFWTVQRGGELESVFPNKLEGDIFPHLVAAQNYTDVLDLAKQESRQNISQLKEFAYSISGTPAVRIRMLRRVSAPVRTPSYMPRGNFQFLWVRGLKDCSTGNQNARCKPIQDAQLGPGTPPSTGVMRGLSALPRVSVWEGHLIVGHHSNGQEGCIGATQHRDPPDTGDCAPPASVTAETINRKDGSFSTNYVRFGVNYSRNWMPDDRELHAIREARGRVEFEIHPRAWVDENMVDLYGRHRLNMAVAYAVRNAAGCRRRLEGSTSAVWNPGVVESVRKLSWTAQVSCYPTQNGGWGLFARMYVGQDYYNIGFLDNMTRVHVGATFNQSGFFRFRRPSTQ